MGHHGATDDALSCLGGVPWECLARAPLPSPTPLCERGCSSGVGPHVICNAKGKTDWKCSAQLTDTAWRSGREHETKTHRMGLDALAVVGHLQRAGAAVPITLLWVNVASTPLPVPAS